ncbi:MAG: hypothetical protein AAB403_02930 [Planctomycetota bacterium]
MATPIERDEEWEKRFAEILRNPSVVDSMNDSAVATVVEECVGRLSRLRMGGRSTPLYALSIVLWKSHNRSLESAFDVEELLATAFRICLDPSFVRPEWGVVLTSVVIARYLERLPAGECSEIVGQCRMNLRFLESSSTVVTAVQQSARVLLACWDAEFPSGLEPVLAACRENWPTSSSVSDVSSGRLREIMDEMNAVLPGLLTERERSLYRLHMERSGNWEALEKASLR